MPLIAWGEALRATAQKHRLLRRRGLACAALIGLVGATVALPPAPRLLWNASASAPLGLYLVSPGATPHAGDMVIARIPSVARDLAARRHYIPANVPLVKRVGAGPGDSVCALGKEIFVNGRWLAERRVLDGLGRPMPWWSGCTTLRDGSYFLLMAEVPDSFDGRYFGISRGDEIVGKARLLWHR
jgi:conjugative transfer signal peptidase TraF